MKKLFLCAVALVVYLLAAQLLEVGERTINIAHDKLVAAEKAALGE